MTGENNTSSSRWRWVLLLNLGLLLLYGWTLTEETAVTLQVVDDTCTDIVPERTLSIPCPNVASGSVGLSYRDGPASPWWDTGPLDWLAPRAAWDSVRLSDGAGKTRWASTFGAAGLARWQVTEGGWRVLAGELRPTRNRALIQRHNPAGRIFTLTARIRRPNEQTGIVLLQPGGARGWAFITFAADRRGTWWRWENGRPVAPLVGVPFQKSLLSQSQTLLRRVLRAHQGGLILLAIGWVLYQGIGAIRARVPRTVRRARWRPGRGTVPALTLLAFLLTTLIAGRVLERIPHVQDSFTYLFQAQTLARGHLSAPAPPVPEAFEQEFMLVQDGRWFGKYPPGFPAVLAVGVLAGAPWLVNPLLAALSIPLLYALGRDLYGRSVGLLAAGLALTSPFFLFMSGNFMAHAAELFWMALFMWAWLRTLRQHNGKRWAVLAGVAVGMAFLTRQLTAVAMGVPFVAATLFRHGRTQRNRDVSPRQGLRSLWRKLLLLSATTLPFLLLLLGYQWALTGDPLQDPRLLFWEYDHLGFGQDIGQGQNAFWLTETEEGLGLIWFHDDTQPPRGHSPARGVFNVEANWRQLERHLFGWPPLLALAFVWLVFLSGRARWQDWLLLLPAGALVGAYVFYWASGISYGPRYFYAALPTLLLLTARGVQVLARWLGGRPGRVTAGLILVILILGTVLANTGPYLDTYRGYNFVSGDKLARAEAAIDEKAIVFVETGSDWWGYGSTFSGNTPWLDGQIIYTRDRGRAENARLLGYFPGRVPYFLTEDSLGRGLTPPAFNN